MFADDAGIKHQVNWRQAAKWMVLGLTELQIICAVECEKQKQKKYLRL